MVVVVVVASLALFALLAFGPFSIFYSNPLVTCRQAEQVPQLHFLASRRHRFPATKKGEESCLGDRPLEKDSNAITRGGNYFQSMSMASSSFSGSGNALMWFRKGLRIHDNPALECASRGVTGGGFLYPVFVIDPHYMEPDPRASSPGSSRAGLNRIRFLLESLKDLDLSLRKLGSRLLVMKGEPGEVLINCLKQKWVATFEKPKGDPSAFLRPATTTLSPYLKFGCVSSRYFYQCIQDVYTRNKKHTSPPVSLLGQLLWRDFFYTVAFGTPNFDQMRGNKICKQIPWNDNDELLTAWREAKTGYPWIDAIMTQWGWMHHLARHCVACFLTRGDLFVHWEKGRDVFERLLIDSDWAINSGNWMWLSCSSFFYQYNRIYSPISFGKKYDPNGNYIRHFLPILKDMPKEYIYEPWTAPLSVQTKAKCIIGKDYPKPMVSHDSASKDCKQKLAAAYELNKKLNGVVSEEDLKVLQRKLDATCDSVLNPVHSHSSSGAKRQRRS
ncbi:unnamed protein product [Linum tenue]|uniref:Photolyase/cryptochrome alpha/beta domain-containing protein n=1 Tax=Linum tenue TaxID=586396 RepID=A0AAV0PJL6_9ROSI|nr:unnamed protein product [Linum tenue]